MESAAILGILQNFIEVMYSNCSERGIALTECKTEILNCCNCRGEQNYIFQRKVKLIQKSENVN